MTQIFLSDNEVKDNLFPFTQMRSVVDIRVGILTIREKWQRLLGQPIQLQEETSVMPDNAIIFSSNIIPTREFVQSLKTKQSSSLDARPGYESIKLLQFPWHIFTWNDWAIRHDFELLTAGRKSGPIPDTVQAINAAQIFIEKGAKLQYCTLNASTGPIYIGEDAEIMEGSHIRGPFSLGRQSVVKMGSRIYGATSIGPCCIVAGEIKNSVFLGYSNKAHDGYLGDAVIGEWCNLGAGTSNSNLKNTGSEIKVWNQSTKEYVIAGLKCGLLMGDYSRSSINTSFNTGTVVGVCSHVFGEGLTPKFIPNFTWGTKGLSKYEFEKALANIRNWKKMKNMELTETEIQKLQHIFDHS